MKTPLSRLMFLPATLRLLIMRFTSNTFAQEVTEAAETVNCDDGFKLVEHALDQVCVPENPQRLMVM
jgi:ABC-type enterochelin transport system substrate-binding protein